MILLRIFASESRRVKPHCQKLFPPIDERLSRLEMDCSLILDNFEKIIRPAAEITGLFTGGFFLSHYIRLFLCSSPRLPYLGVAKVSRAFFKETLDPFCVGYIP